MGTPFRFLTQDRKVSDEVTRLFGGFPKATRAARAQNIVQIVGDASDLTGYHDCLKLGGTGERLFPNLVSSVNNYAINQSPYFAVHAGVARWGERIVALPAESGQGKTTLTAALVSGGFDFLSDEALAFDDEGTVIPYPKPFALTRWSAEAIGVLARSGETLATASDLGGAVGQGGRLTDLVLAEYGHAPTALETLPRSQAVAALIGYSFNHFKEPARAFRITTEVAREVTVWRLRYGNPREGAELLSRAIR